MNRHVLCARCQLKTHWMGGGRTTFPYLLTVRVVKMPRRCTTSTSDSVFFFREAKIFTQDLIDFRNV